MANASDPPTGLLAADGKCSTCEKSALNTCVTCFLCLKKFHAYGCSDPSSTICNQTFLNSFKPLNEKTGVNSSRPGNFLFVCDFCMTDFEQKRSMMLSDKFSCLQNQINKVDERMSEVVKLIQKGMRNDDGETQEKNANCWDNTNKSKLVNTSSNNFLPPAVDPPVPKESQSILVIDKIDDEACKSDALDVLERIVVEKNIGVKNSYENRKGNTVFVCNSEEQRKMLESEIKQNLPDVSVNAVNSLSKTIAVVGFSSKYNASNIVPTILKQNNFVDDFIKLKSNGNIANHMQLVNVTPLKNNGTLHQAVLRVSSQLRSFLKNQEDRLLVGLRSVVIYDRLFVKRCFGCQKYGHIRSKCPTPDVVCCSKCGGNHENKICKVTPDKFKCVNCKSAGHSDISHSTSSTCCPVFKTERDKLLHLN